MSDRASDLAAVADPARQDGTRYNVHDPGEWSGAVLLADEIKHYCDTLHMIHPFEPERLRPASYQLRLGEEIHIGGEDRRLLKNEPTPLAPHQVAVVSTHEILKIPRFLIARWSLRVTNIYEGLLWTGGPQVDPGWEGQLYCPIYNLSDRWIQLFAEQPFFSIDFVRTTALSPQYHTLATADQTKKTWFEVSSSTLSDHDRYRLHSGPFEKLRDVEDLAQFRSAAQTVMTMMFTAIAGIIAALAFITASDFINPGGDPFDTYYLAMGAAVLLSLVGTVGLGWMVWRIYSTLNRFQQRR